MNYRQNNSLAATDTPGDPGPQLSRNSRRIFSDLQSCFATLLSPETSCPDFLVVSLSQGLGLGETLRLGAFEEDGWSLPTCSLCETMPPLATRDSLFRSGMPAN